MKVAHLVRRFFQSLRSSELSASDLSTVATVLSKREYILWTSMHVRDQRHSMVVLHRFDVLRPDADVTERRAALLHDIGKIGSVGVIGRVLATLVGPRTSRLREYLRHEEIGLELLRDVSERRTLEVLAMPIDDSVVQALREADDI